MLEHSIYSVIAPEGCASSLWRQADRGSDAAKALKLTAQSAKDFDLIDQIITEPTGGAHSDWPETFANMKRAILSNLEDLDKMSPTQIYEDRYIRFRKMGVYEDLLMV
jgi:acetyl-CoA carboxylase carboxyl transferase subunit alpha